MPQLTPLLSSILLITVSVVVLVAGTIIVYRMRKDLFDDDTPTRAERLAPYKEAYEQGLMAQQEFLRIKQAIESMPPGHRGDPLAGISRNTIEAELDAARRQSPAGQPASDPARSTLPPDTAQNSAD